MVTSRLSRKFYNPKDAEFFFHSLYVGEKPGASTTSITSPESPEQGDVPVVSPEQSLIRTQSATYNSPEQGDVPQDIALSPEPCSLSVDCTNRYGSPITLSNIELSCSQAAVPSVESYSNSPSNVVESIDTLVPLLRRLELLNENDKISFLGEVFSKIAKRDEIDVPPDYLLLSLNAMKQLVCAGRSNIVYGLSKGLGTLRPNKSDSVFPSKSLITGLVEYSVNFLTLAMLKM